MSKGLKALEDLYEYTSPYINVEDIDELHANTCYQVIQKELKAFEIIKKKQVNMFSLLSSIKWFNPSHYNDSVGCPIGCELTQEEYDLLKEVLL